MNKRTQNAKVIDWLATGRPLTPIQAFTRWKIMRLAARVFDLRKQGHDIDNVGTSRFAKYKLQRA